MILYTILKFSSINSEAFLHISNTALKKSLSFETIQLKKEICKDYALLTTGLLLKMDYFHIYIIRNRISK